MLGSVGATKQMLKCATLIKCQQHFRTFCLRSSIFRIRTVRRKSKARNVLLLYGGLLIKPIIRNAFCKDQLVSLHY